MFTIYDLRFMNEDTIRDSFFCFSSLGAKIMQTESRIT